MMKWLETCYADITTSVMLGGALGPPIEVSRSVRQGCPMSPVLFALYLEPLCRMIATSNSIRGLVLGNEELRVLAYADDIAVVCTSRTQVSEVAELARRFCRFSGAELNLSKSEGYWLGEWELKPPSFCGARWKDSIHRYLGVNMALWEANAARWRPRLTAAEAKLQPWRTRHIALVARAHICNVVVYPATLYSARVTSIDKKSVNKLHRQWAVFVWRSSYEPMRRTNLFWGLDAGGLGLVHVEIKLTVQRFIYFRDQSDPFLRGALQSIGSAHISKWQVTTVQLHHGARAAPFYREIAGAITLLEQQFSWDYLLAVKPRRLYRDLLAKLLPPPLYRQPPVEAAKRGVLKRIMCLPIPTGTKNFFCRFHFGVLPVGSRQEERGFFLPRGAGCFLCGRLETAEHVFLECNTARYFWDEVQCFLGVHWDIDWAGLRYLDVPIEHSELCECVITLGLHSLWRARVDAVECTPTPKPAWRHFVHKMEWTVSALGAPDSDSELGQALARCCRATVAFKTKELERFKWI